MGVLVLAPHLMLKSTPLFPSWSLVAINPPQYNKTEFLLLTPEETAGTITWFSPSSTEERDCKGALEKIDLISLTPFTKSFSNQWRCYLLYN